MRTLAAALSVAVALGACGGDDATPEQAAAERLGRLVDRGLGDGLTAVGSATGSMDVELAARATAVRPGDLEPWLRTNAFQHGYSAVWTRGEGLGQEVVTVLVYHFLAERNAEAFVGFAAARLATSRTHRSFDDPAVPGSRGFVLTSRVNRATKFCVGELFAVRTDAYVVTRCAPFPLQPEQVTGLAQRQLVHAVTAGTP